MGKRAHGEGTLFQRADGRWAAQIDLGTEGGRRVRKTIYGRTQKEVRMKFDEAKRNLAAGRPAVGDRQPLGTFLANWLDGSVDPSTLAPSTKASYRYIVESHIVPVLGDVALRKLKAQDVQRLLKVKHDEGLSARTRELVHAVLRRALTEAHQHGLVVVNVASSVKPPKPRRDPDKVHPLTLAHARAIFTTAANDRLFAAWGILLLMGLRKGELLALRWSDIDMNTGTMSISRTLSRVKGKGLVFGPTKTERSTRATFIPPVCLSALQRHFVQQETERLAAGSEWRDSGLIFTTRSGRPIEPSGLNRLFKAVCKRAGIGHERIHNLRHTAGTLMRASGGADLLDVQAVLGHSDIAVTAAYYGHQVPAIQRELSVRMSDLYEAFENPLAVNLAVNPMNGTTGSPSSSTS